MFAIGGIVYVKVLPEDRSLRLLGMPNRLAIGLGFSIVAVAVEVLLHATGYFHWDYWWWNWPFVPLIVVFGYLWFFLVAAWVYDMRDTRRQVRAVTAFAAVDLALIVIFGPVLGWI
jgi:cation transport ATPase